LPHLAKEEILATGITWHDFCRFLIGKVVRMALDVYVCSNFNLPDGAINNVLFIGGVDDSGGLHVRVRPGTATETYTETCNSLVRLLATSEKRDIEIHGGERFALPLPVSGPALSHLFERIHSQEHIINFNLGHAILSEEHIRVLAIATAPRHELQLVLEWCRLSDNDACKNALVQWL
jgi:hypothetical protein